MGCLVKADPAFSTVPISGLALPGSHNAGTFNLDPGSFDTQSNSPCTDFTPEDATLGDSLNPFFETQDEMITQQLDQGVRFVDLQVAYNGNGNPLSGWRVVQSQFSEWPLFDYLDQVAQWARSNPSEVVIVDLRNVCYGDRSDPAIAAGLFSNFTTPSNVGGGSTTLADVAYDAGTSSAAFASATIGEVVGQDGGGHNVVIMLPGSVTDLKSLESRYHVHVVVTENASSDAGSSDALPLAFSNAEVTPTSGSEVPAANQSLASHPASTSPAQGSLVGVGFYVAQLAYQFDPAQQAALLAGFGGLILSTTVPGSTPPKVLAPWEESLWDPSAHGITALSRNEVAGGWGHRAGVILADGVENDGFAAAVIALNAK